MQLTKKTFYIGLAAGSLLAGSAVMAADGAALYTAKKCNTCHGTDANTPKENTTYPKLGGQKEGYLLAQLKDIRDSKRTNGQSAVMITQPDGMATVSDDEAAAIAKWIASQPAAAGGAKTAAVAPYTAKMCQTCHGPDANTPTVSTYPKLGGQNETYLLTQLKDIRDGKRANGQTVVMKAMMDAMKVSDDEAAAIAKWIASQPAK